MMRFDSSCCAWLHWADDVALFMDNLSVHRSRDVKERLEELGMPAIFNNPKEMKYKF